MIFTGIRAGFGQLAYGTPTCQRRTAAPGGSTDGRRPTIVALFQKFVAFARRDDRRAVIVIAQFQESLTAMIKAVHLPALAVLGVFLLSGAAYASDTPAQPSQPSPPQGDQAPPPPGAPATPAAPQTTEKDPLDEIVCRKEEATVGSRLGARKVCKTRRQWRDEKRDATSNDLPDGSLLPGPTGSTS
jgi:hypothetical protein